MDIADACGAFGLLSGGLSALLPYFLGLVVALSILGAGVGLLRLGVPNAGAPPAWRTALPVLAAVAIGWVLFLGAPGPVARFRGLALGLSAVPLWVKVRKDRPFGGWA